MTISDISALLAYILVVGYTPGPANLYTLSCTFKYGRRQALAMWWGLMAGFSVEVWTVAAICRFLGTSLGEHLACVRYVGAAYILWLAWGIARRGGTLREASRSTCSFLSGMVVQLTNAKIILFNITMFGMFVIANGNRLEDYLVVGALLYLAGPGGNLAWLFGGVLLRKWYERHARILDLAMGLALAAFAVLMILPQSQQ